MRAGDSFSMPYRDVPTTHSGLPFLRGKGEAYRGAQGCRRTSFLHHWIAQNRLSSGSEGARQVDGCRLGRAGEINAGRASAFVHSPKYLFGNPNKHSSEKTRNLVRKCYISSEALVSISQDDEPIDCRTQSGFPKDPKDLGGFPLLHT